MKNINLLIFVLAIGCTLGFYSCKKDIEINQTYYEAVVPAKEDLNAGNWKVAVLSKPEDIVIDAPLDPTSPEYLAELAEAKSMNASVTDKQKEAIKYWAAGGVIRWNQIMRQLVAKYNLPPVEGIDGKYPVPQSNNPLAYPNFPFANPPYAARAYAYFSVAVYDALVATNYHRVTTPRKAPYAFDSSINPLVYKSELSSYPSEDAVVASVALEMLTLLFPGEVPYLTDLANEQKNTRLWAGANVRSDIAAGEALAKLVVAKIKIRAKDGMAFANGNPTIHDSIPKAIEAQGLLPWISLESPARPSMLIKYGDVKTWLMDKAGMIAIRPAVPPAANSDEVKAQIQELKDVLAKKDRDQIAICHYWADGVGTYTPPGHWNYVATDLIYNAKMSEVRVARTYALLNMAMMDAGISCWDTKSFYFYPRPSQVDPEIKTFTGVPNFPAYTSGHSTFSGAASRILSHLFPANASQLDAKAIEASESRIYGGIHFRMDCEVGLAVGHKIGDLAIARAATDGAD